jgi:hypothetical protein
VKQTIAWYDVVEVGNFGAKIRRTLTPPWGCINMEIEQNAMRSGGIGAVGDSIVNEMKIKKGGLRCREAGPSLL